jgi:hypothetical protein
MKLTVSELKKVTPDPDRDLVSRPLPDSRLADAKIYALRPM